MQHEIMFAGFGGQGILSSGKILAHAAMEEGRQVVWIPSYGPEMRGGTAYCMVLISNKPINSPVVRNPMHLVAMNRPSLKKFAPLIRPKGVILINSSMVRSDSGRGDVDEVRVPVNDIAKNLGDAKSANIVALSAFVARSGVVAFDTLLKSIAHEFMNKKEAIPLCLKAAEAGRRVGAKP